MITRTKSKTRKEKGWQMVTVVESQDILLETVGEAVFDRLQVIQSVHLQEEHRLLPIQLVNNMPVSANRVVRQRPNQWSEELRTMSR